MYICITSLINDDELLSIGTHMIWRLLMLLSPYSKMLIHMMWRIIDPYLWYVLLIKW